MNTKSNPFLTTLHLILMAATLFALPAVAEYVTPGLGSVYLLDDLVNISGGAVTGSGNDFQVNESVVISQGDRLDIGAGKTLTFVDATGTIGLEVNGGLRVMGSAEEPVLMTGSVATPGSWRGLDFNDVNPGSEFHLDYVEIAYADIGVDVLDGDIILNYCDIHDCLSKAVDITSADGMISDCHLHHNQQRTVSMTLSSSPTFENCTLDHNNLENSSPYPYFNIGLQGVNSPTIRGCTIEGNGIEMSGGMALWNSSSALIADNTISGCGYGILCYSVGANPTIVGNTIFDNTIHPDTVNWGFGVACNGDNAPILMENTITGHWYGVAAINGGQPNLGDVINDFPGDDGLNHIHDNGLTGSTYGFYNNTPLPQMAQNNYWGPVGAEDSIFHQPDDPSLGLVTYDPVAGSSPAADLPGPQVLTAVNAFPNPFNPRVEIRLSLTRDSHVSAVVMDAAGRMVRQLQAGQMADGEHTLLWDGSDRSGQAAASGIYFYRVVAGNESRVGKLTLVR